MFFYQLELIGLHCQKCVTKVKNTLEQSPVIQCHTISTNFVQISSPLSFSELQAQIQSIGYDAEDLNSGNKSIIQFSLSGLSCDKCIQKVKLIISNLGSIELIKITKTTLVIKNSGLINELITAIQQLGFQIDVLSHSSKASDANNTVQISSKTLTNSNVDKNLFNKTEKSNIVYKELLISGMTCASCVSSVEKALKQASDVRQVHINLANHSALLTVNFSKEPLKQEMLIIKNIQKAGYDAQFILNEDSMRQQQEEQFKQTINAHKKNAITGLTIGIPLMLWGVFGGSMLINNLFDQIIWGGIGIICFMVLMTAGRLFYVHAWQSLQNRRATMDTLVSLGTGAAWLYSMLVVIFPHWFPNTSRHVYFEASTMIIGLISLGQFIEVNAKSRTNNALQTLMNLQPKSATVIINKKETVRPIAAIKKGMLVRIYPGEQIPIDGLVVEGESFIDESMLTGESLPIKKKIDDAVSAGTINTNGSLIIKVSATGEKTTLSRIIKLVKQAQTSKPRVAKLADTIAAIFVPIVLMIAFISAFVWAVWGPSPQISYILVVVTSVLIIACPCALGLATPLSITVGIGKAAELGVLIKDADVLQNASKISTIVFDKTGTLTIGKPTVQSSVFFEPSLESITSQFIYDVEQLSEHPLAKALCQHATHKQKINELNDIQNQVTNFKVLQGMGVKATVNNKIVLIGNPALFDQQKIDYSMAKNIIQSYKVNAYTTIMISVDGNVQAIFGVSDPIRHEAKQMLIALRKRNINVVMLTGDSHAVAHSVGHQLGIEHVISEVLPDEKAAAIIQLQKKTTGSIAMVGDGINDAPALAQADISIAMGSGSDIAIENAQITLLNSSPMAIIDSIDLAKATLRNIKQNLFGAFFYNSLCIPIAAGVLYPIFGFLLSPVFAGAAMALSSITVVSNANRLRLFKSKSNQ